MVRASDRVSAGIGVSKTDRMDTNLKQEASRLMLIFMKILKLQLNVNYRTATKRNHLTLYHWYLQHTFITKRGRNIAKMSFYAVEM
jgi:hypothetical protein